MSKKLYRSTKDKMVGGVCGGLAAYFGVDATLIRLLWAFTTLLYGAGVLAYIVAWIIIPEAPKTGMAAGKASSLADTAPPGHGEAGEGTAATGGPGEAIAGAGNPEAEEGEAHPEGRKIAGIILVLIGAYFLLRNLLPPLPWGQIWPLVLVIIGLGLILGRQREKEGNQE